MSVKVLRKIEIPACHFLQLHVLCCFATSTSKAGNMALASLHWSSRCYSGWKIKPELYERAEGAGERWKN